MDRIWTQIVIVIVIIPIIHFQQDTGSNLSFHQRSLSEAVLREIEFLLRYDYDQENIFLSNLYDRFNRNTLQFDQMVVWNRVHVIAGLSEKTYRYLSAIIWMV